jgi:hypothetical protein
MSAIIAAMMINETPAPPGRVALIRPSNSTVRAPAERCTAFKMLFVRRWTTATLNAMPMTILDAARPRNGDENEIQRYSDAERERSEKHVGGDTCTIQSGYLLKSMVAGTQCRENGLAWHVPVSYRRVHFAPPAIW